MGGSKWQQESFNIQNSLMYEEKLRREIRLLNMKKGEYLVIIREVYNNRYDGENK